MRLIGNTLLDMPNIRRMRFATKGLAVMPMKLLTDEAWVEAVTDVAKRGRKLHKEVCIHTHFNHPREITDISRARVRTAVRGRRHGAQPVRTAARRQRRRET